MVVYGIKKSEVILSGRNFILYFGFSGENSLG